MYSVCLHKLSLPQDTCVTNCICNSYIPPWWSFHTLVFVKSVDFCEDGSEYVSRSNTCTLLVMLPRFLKGIFPRVLPPTPPLYRFIIALA